MAAVRNRLSRWWSGLTSRVSARARVAVGLVFLLVSVLWLAVAIGIVPNERAAVMAGRARLCEAIAVSGSVFVERGEGDALAATLRSVVGRNEDVLSAGVRDEAGRLAVEVGDHETHWGRLSGEAAIDSYIFVPVYANEARWGTVELRFRPLYGDAGWLAQVNTPQVRLMAFVGAACAVLFHLYLRKMLQHLDPSKVVPSRVRSALDTLAEGLLVMDNAERIVLANHAIAALLGKAPGQLLGARASTLPWVREADAHGELPEFPWLAAIASGRSRKAVQMRLVDARGVRRTFSVNCSPVLGHDGKYRGVLASFDDVSALEHKEVELRRSKDAAEAYAAAAESANRAKSEFLAHMSHEIRTPMNAVLGFTDALRRGYEAGEAERREYLDTIHASGQHLLELINDILDLSKIESGRLEVERTAVQPHQVIGDVVRALGVRAREKGVALDYAWDGPLPATVRTDPTRLRQVLTNLVGNAIKFTPAGSVRVVARLVAAPAGGTVGDTTGPRLAVDVVDTGVGMKPEGLSRIFQPFAQADSSITRRFGGTGLGLAISRQLAEALGGGIEVASEYGKGSTFTVTIATGPLDGVAMLDAMPDATGATPAHATASPAGGGGGGGVRLRPARVLVVEDGTSNQKLIALVLGRAGLHVDLASDGQAGVEMATAGRYDVVLMDMQMPVMDGFTATAALRARGYAVPIIALTAHAMKGEEDKCRAAGCSGFLTKPIDIDLLLRTLADVLGDAPAALTESDATPAPAAAIEPGTAATAAAATLVSSLPTEDPDFREIVVEFVDRLRQQLSAMEAAWSEGHLGELASLAHWLKGSGGTAGFAAFTEPAAALERCAKEARLEDVERTIAELTRLASCIAVPDAGTVDEARLHVPPPQGVRV